MRYVALSLTVSLLLSPAFRASAARAQQPMPVVVKQRLPEAMELLKRMGYGNVRIAWEQTDRIPPDIVVWQYPNPQEERLLARSVASSTPIRLVVSQSLRPDRAVDTVYVPRVVTRIDTVYVPRIVTRVDTVYVQRIVTRRDTVYLTRDVPRLVTRTDTVYVPRVVTRVDTAYVQRIVTRRDTVYVTRDVPRIVTRRDTVYLTRDVPRLVTRTDTVYVPQVVTRVDTLREAGIDTVFQSRVDTVPGLSVDDDNGGRVSLAFLVLATVVALGLGGLAGYALLKRVPRLPPPLRGQQPLHGDEVPGLPQFAPVIVDEAVWVTRGVATRRADAGSGSRDGAR